jgi:hypothetical protein
VVSARLAITAVLAAGAAAGCTITEQVLGGDNAPITSCAEVWARGVDGAACDLADPCDRPLPSNPMCCVELAYCAMDELVMLDDCDPACVSACVDDLGCPDGSICDGTSCVACPPGTPGDPTGVMCQTSCPPGWGFLTRNGCTICQCAPLPECTTTDPNMPGQGCNAMLEQCYRGDPVDLGCAPDDDGCFPSTCSTPGCMSNPPLGCAMPCDPAQMGMMCQQCATASCECDPMTGAWICQPFCIDSTPMILSC